MTQRVTIPEGHVAVIMTEQLALEVNNVLLNMRARARYKGVEFDRGNYKFGKPEFDVAGDGSLAISTAILISLGHVGAAARASTKGTPHA